MGEMARRASSAWPSANEPTSHRLVDVARENSLYAQAYVGSEQQRRRVGRGIWLVVHGCTLFWVTIFNTCFVVAVRSVAPNPSFVVRVAAVVCIKSLLKSSPPIFFFVKAWKYVLPYFLLISLVGGWPYQARFAAPCLSLTASIVFAIVSDGFITRFLMLGPDSFRTKLCQVSFCFEDKCDLPTGIRHCGAAHSSCIRGP